MIVRSSDYFSGELVSNQLLHSVICEHRRGMDRLSTLREYYDGKNSIASRRRTDGLPNNRVCHGYARYISTMASGYLIGSPVKYAYAGNEASLESVLGEYARGNIDSVDSEIARYASIYGKGVEIIYQNALRSPRTCAVSPEEAFCVYDESVARDVLFGVHYLPSVGLDGEINGWRVNVYTDRLRQEYAVSRLEQIRDASPVRVSEHFFAGVPINEYWNGEDEKGDFESAISLIDAYDALQSDRVNDKEQFVDALLVLIGARLDIDSHGRTPAKQLREDKALSLPDGCDVKWLYKSLSEADTDVLRKALNDDIHKMCMIPDLTDANFSGNASGVAMKYKLLGFEQLIKVKERWFREGLRERLRRFAQFMRLKGSPALDASLVDITFSRGLPVNELEQAQVVEKLRGADVMSLSSAVARINPEWNDEQISCETALIRDAPRGNGEAFGQMCELQSRGGIGIDELRGWVTGENANKARLEIERIKEKGRLETIE